MVFYYLLLLSAYLIPGSLFLLEDPSPCKYHKVVKKSPERSMYHLINNPTLCDKDLNAWYRFEEGEIATSCVPDNHCNKNTIWMNDTFPTVSDGIQTKNFCGKVSFSGLPASSCCNYKFTVKVLNCGDFMTYEFIEWHLSGGLVQCPIAYCTDTIPRITGIDLKGPRRSDDGFEFECSFDYEPTNETDGIDFEVTWLFNKNQVASEVVTADSHTKSVTSNESLWMNHFGESLSCSVVAYHHGRVPNGIGKSSNEYFGGIKIEPQPVVLTEGNEIEATITSTLPILCNNSESSNCSLVLGINNYKKEEVKTSTCVITLTTSPHTVSSTETLRLKLESDIMLHRENQHNLSLKMQPIEDLESFFQGQEINLIVTTKNVPHIDCNLFPDCHIFGFNKSRLSTIEYPGDFLLYNSSMDQDSHLEVHVRQMVIEGVTPSTCGVAMRYGDEILFLDICTYKTVPVITRNTRKERLTVSECGGNLYLISASNGVKLHVQVYNSKMAILLYGPLKKSARNTDLCSFEAATSSLTKDDLLPFRLDRSTSLFRDRSKTVMVDNHLPATANCHCRPHSTECKQSSEVLNPLSMKTCKILKVQKIGSTLDSEISENYEVRYWAWPTKSGRSKDSSLTDCQIAITHNAPRMCVNGLFHFLHMFNSACLDNVMKTDSTEGHIGVTQAFTWFCQTKALLNSNQSLDINTTSRITSDTCPNFCSLNGNCDKGVCRCDDGYISEDCSVRNGTTTSIVGIVGGETCALSSGRCLHPTIMVNSRSLVTWRDLHAHLIPIIFKGKMITLTQDATSLSLDHFYYDYASSLNMTGYQMNDRTAYGYRIFITGSGGSSNFVDYVIYDDKCRRCFSTKLVDDVLCTLKEDSCHINDHCYKQNEVDPYNPNKNKCNPYKSLLNWSPV